MRTRQPTPERPIVLIPARKPPGQLARRIKLLVFGLTVAGAAFAVSAGTVASLNWMETPEFCGTCHTMKPELQAYEQAPHRSVECGECHIGRGINDLIQAKLQGSIQLLHLLEGSYPRPIPPAAHGMVNGAQSCLQCHKEPRSNRDVLLMRSHFQEDEQNTRQDVALVIKLDDATPGRTRGIHWHVKSQVELLARDERSREIDYVRVTESNGEVKEYVSQDLLRRDESSDALREARVSGALKRMDCLNCHNRVGHEFLSPSRALDDAMSDGRIDPSIPYVKKKGLELLSASYSSSEAAEAAIDQLELSYRLAYPDVFAQKGDRIVAAEREFVRLYGLVASPEMQATYQTYPSFMGHRDTPAGCFRCHDGAHVRVDERGAPGKETIPFSCSLCHSFPQQGEPLQAIPVGAMPPNHRSREFLIDHQAVAGSLEVGATSCVSCHSQRYCDNCHAARLVHPSMLFNHAAALREQGSGSCVGCHQPAFCVRCHEGEVLKKEQPP